jgi:hypothetical protein
MSFSRLALMLVFAGCLATSGFAQSVSLTATNSNHYYPNFVVGDAWTLTIYGAAPGVPVDITGWFTPTPPMGEDPIQESFGTTPFGDTDSVDGHFSISSGFDSSTVGTWIEDIRVDGVFIGELTFSVTLGPQTCTFGDTGSLFILSTDNYLGAHALAGGYPQAWGTVVHYIYSGPCEFTGTSVAHQGYEGTWIDAAQTNYGSEMDWTAYDTGGPSEASSHCPRCADDAALGYYPFYDYATLTSTIYNDATGGTQMQSTLVTLYVNLGWY